MASKKFIFLMVITLSVSSMNFISSAADDSGDKVKLNVYYESLCPYSANFTVQYLPIIFKTDLINIVDLRLVPWGNTQISANNTFICQHGVDECQLDLVEACAINVWPDVSTNAAFVTCIETFVLMNNHTGWQACFSLTGLDQKPIADCLENGSAYQLEKGYANETANLNPPHEFVPWVVVNDLPLQDDYMNLVTYICKAYTGNNIPDVCKSSLVHNNLPKAAGTSAPEFTNCITS